MFMICALVAHGVSSLASAGERGQRGISGGSVGDNFAEILGANIGSATLAILVNVNLGPSFELVARAGSLGMSKNLSQAIETERAGLDVAFL